MGNTTWRRWNVDPSLTSTNKACFSLRRRVTHPVTVTSFPISLSFNKLLMLVDFSRAPLNWTRRHRRPADNIPWEKVDGSASAILLLFQPTRDRHSRSLSVINQSRKMWLLDSETDVLKGTKNTHSSKC